MGLRSSPGGEGVTESQSSLLGGGGFGVLVNLVAYGFGSEYSLGGFVGRCGLIRRRRVGLTWLLLQAIVGVGRDHRWVQGW